MMSNCRFELLLKFSHFSNNQEEHADQYRLFKLRLSLDLLRARFQSIYAAGSIIFVNETTVP